MAFNADLRRNPKQAQFILATEDTVALVGGAGSGKSYIGAVWALKQAMGQPGSAGMVVTPTVPMMQHSMLPILLHIAAESELNKVWTYNKQERCITLPNGSVIYLRSADNPSSLLGATLAWAVGDEAALWKKQAFYYLSGRIRQPGFNLQMAFTFTPKGQTHWTFKEFGTSKPGVRIIRTSTFDNKALPKAYLNRLKRDYVPGSTVWKQEVEGEFVRFQGLVYAFEYFKHVRDKPADVPLLKVNAAVDWGWTNPGCILVGGIDADGVEWVIDEVYATEKDVGDWWVPKAKELKQKYGISYFDCDPSEPENIKKFRNHGLNARPANNAVIPGITSLATRFLRRRIYVGKRCINLARELGLYSWKENPDGSFKPDEPNKVDDHSPDTLRYLNAGLEKPDPVMQLL